METWKRRRLLNCPRNPPFRDMVLLITDEDELNIVYECTDSSDNVFIESTRKLWREGVACDFFLLLPTNKKVSYCFSYMKRIMRACFTREFCIFTMPQRENLCTKRISVEFFTCGRQLSSLVTTAQKEIANNNTKKMLFNESTLYIKKISQND